MISFNKRIILFLGIGALIIGIIFYRYIGPFGKITRHEYSSKIPIAEEITSFTPTQDGVLQIPRQIIKTNRSEFSLKSPQNISEVKAVMKFKKGAPEIRLGVKGNEKDTYQYRPLYHSLLQELNWTKVQSEGMTLWQKEKKYKDLYEFVQSPPPDQKTALYFVDTDQLLNLKPSNVSKDEKKDEKIVFNTRLRGNHTFLIQVNKTPLTIKVAKQDINIYKGEDKVKVRLTKNQNIISEEEIGDDGVSDDSRLSTQPTEKTIVVADAKVGVYQLDIFAEKDDFTITKVEINQTKLVIRDRVFTVADKPSVFMSNIGSLNILTPHENYTQTIKIDDKHKIEIKEASKNYNEDVYKLTGKTTGELYKIESPRNDLLMQGKGYFSITQDSFFIPEVVQAVDLSSVIDMKDISYIITSNQDKLAKTEGDWLISEVNFDPSSIRLDENKTLYFSLEIPQNDKTEKGLEVGSLEIVVNAKGSLEAINNKNNLKSNKTLVGTLGVIILLAGGTILYLKKKKGAFNKFSPQ